MIVRACEYHKTQAAKYGKIEDIGERVIAMATERLDDYGECSDPPCRIMSQTIMEESRWEDEGGHVPTTEKESN